MKKYGFCLDASRKYAILDEIGEHFLENAIQHVKAGHKFVVVLDNIDWMEKVHDMRADAQNKSVHAISTSIVFSRITSTHLDDSGPQDDLKKCDLPKIISMSEAEVESLRKRYRILLAKILFNHFPELGKYKQCISETTDCLYSTKTAQKSEMVTMPVLMKDEKKYSD